jgi:DNA-binding CsgD family transcriptional regulator
MLLGRERECQQLDRLLARARSGTSGVLVLHGEPGVGKSALLRYLIESAPGMIVVSTEGVEPESELAFSGLADLLRPLSGYVDALPEPQAAALRGVLRLGPAVSDSLALGVAMLGLWGIAAEQAPLLVVVDDAQWLDQASLQALLFASRRLEAEAVAVVFAARTGETAELERGLVPMLELEGLEREPAKLLLTRSATTPIPDGLADQLVTMTQGNPLALLELPALLSQAQLAGTEPLDQPLPIGASLTRAFARRLEAMPVRARLLLLVAAASGSGLIDLILEAAGLLGPGAADLEYAEVAGIVTVQLSRLSFQHPLLRSVVYHGAAAADRRRAHGALAEALEDQVDDAAAEARVWHLAAAALGPDEQVASLLEQAGASARERGGYAAAAAAFEQSARLSPQGPERARRLLEAAGHLQFAGQLEQSVRLLDEAEQLSSDKGFQAEIQRLRAWVSTWSGAPADAHRLWLSAVERIETADPGRASQMLAEAAIVSTMTGDVALAMRVSKRAYALAERAGCSEDAAALGVYSNALVLNGQAAEALPLLRRCERAFDNSDLLALAPVFAQALGHGRIWIEQYAESRRTLERIIGAARTAAGVGVLPFPLACLAELEFRTGNWTAAYANASESVQLAEETGQANELCFSLLILAELEAVLAQEQACREHVRRADEGARVLGITSLHVYAGSVLGLLELGLGRPRLALDHLDPAAQLSRRLGCREPGVVWFGANLVEAHLRAGQVEDARRELRQLEREARETNRIWALAAAARCRGMLADDGGFLREFDESLALHAELDAPFERARTELCYGERLRRTRQTTAARHQLHAALTTFDRLGAASWARSAGAELHASGDHTPRQDHGSLAQRLTAQELQVARTIAQGATNREAASALFLSPKTIEFHLSNIYRKLELRSRTELVRAILTSDNPGRNARQDASD